MRRTRLLPRALVVVALVALALPAARGADAPPSTARIGQVVENVPFAAPGRNPARIHDLKGQKATVVVFLSFECPVSTSYAAILADLAGAYESKGVAFLGVCPCDEQADQLAKLAHDFKIPFPVSPDRDRTLTSAFQAAFTPEAFVLDGSFTLRYRGRIDNGYAARLKKNQQITRQDLRDALEAVVAGKTVETASTLPVGCPILPPEKRSAAAAAGAVTYHRDVEPILQKNCQGCHRPGQAAPFALMTYKQAVNWADDVRDYTQSRKMPPWKPTEGHAMVGERKLTDEQIATIARWVDAGTPEGDPKDAPAPVTYPDGWQLGTPDLILTPSEEFVLGPTGKDHFRVYVLPTHLTEDKYVVAYEVRPGNPRVVHHTLNFFDALGRGRKLEEAAKEKPKDPNGYDQGPGYAVGMGGVGFRALPDNKTWGGIGGWAPGYVARYLPEGTGYFLPKGSDILLQVHYHRNGRVEKDRSQIGLYFAKKPVEKPFQGTLIGAMPVIPPFMSEVKISGGGELLQDATLYSVMPHMHLLGKSVKVTMTPPGGQPETLVAIKDWDYNWQETYFLQKPIQVKVGTRFQIDAVYDNSVKNPNQPSFPPRVVTYGEQTTDEMLFGFLGMTGDKPGRVVVFPDRGGFNRRPRDNAEPGKDTSKSGGPGKE
jgi:mono/diheme cytochrome c family protein